MLFPERKSPKWYDDTTLGKACLLQFSWHWAIQSTINFPRFGINSNTVLVHPGLSTLGVMSWSVSWWTIRGSTRSTFHDEHPLYCTKLGGPLFVAVQGKGWWVQLQKAQVCWFYFLFAASHDQCINSHVYFTVEVHSRALDSPSIGRTGSLWNSWISWLPEGSHPNKIAESY